jgi:hypothetical protein
MEIGAIYIEFGRSKPRGLSDWIVLNVILFNKHIFAMSGASSESYFLFFRGAFAVVFTLSDLASSIGDIYTKVLLVLRIESKGGTLTLDKVIPPYVNTALTSFDTAAYGLYFLAGVYFLSVLYKYKVRGREKIHKRYLAYYTLTSIAFTARAIPGLVLSVMTDWFTFRRTYAMAFLDCVIYAAMTSILFFAWTRLAKNPPLPLSDTVPEVEIPDTNYHNAGPSQQIPYDPSKYVYVAIKPDHEA